MAVAVAGTPTVGQAASATSVTCAVPSGVTAGELLLASVTHSSTTAIPDQSGWTQIGQGNSGSSGIATALFRRVATASEPASYTFTGLASGAVSAEMTRLSGANTSNPLDSAVVTAGSAATTAFTMPSLSTATAGALAISTVALFSISSNIFAGSGNPATIIANTTGTGRRAVLADEARPTAGSVGTRQWTSGSSAKWAGVSVAIAPATSPGVSATVTGATAQASAAANPGSLSVGLSIGATVTGATAQVTAAANPGALVLPGLTITVTPQLDTTPPAMRIDVADIRFNAATSLIITRRNPDGHSYPVRTSDGGPLLLSAGQATVYDYEPPYDAPIIYSTDQPGVPAVTSELFVDDVWLVHPGVPSLSQKLHLTALDDRTRDTARTLYQILSRQDPLPVSSGARPAASATLGVRTYTEAQRAALDLLLSDDAPLLLNIPAALPWGWTATYVSCGQLMEKRTVRYGRFPYREWTLPIQVVGRPGGGTQAAVTWATVAAQYPTWQSIVDAGVTSWAELAAPTT